MRLSTSSMLRRMALCALGAAATVFFAGDARSATVQDFDAPGTAYVLTQHGNPPGPMVAPGGLSGNFLALLQDTGSLSNSIAFERSDGRSDSISIEFDYVMPDESTHGGCCGQRADGFGVLLLNSDQHGSGATAPVMDFAWERPATRNALGIGFDIFDGDGNPATPGDGNTVSVTLNGVQILQQDVTGMQLNNSPSLTDPALIVANHVIISLTNLGTDPRISMDIIADVTNPGGPTPVSVFNNVPLPNAFPFAGGARLAIGGRTGGAYTALLMDNIFANFAGAPFAPAASMSQDFDAPGAAFQMGKYGDVNNSGPTIQAAEAGSTGAFVRLAHDQPSQNNQIAFDAMSVSAPTHVISFDYRMPTDAGHTGCCGERADGFGLALANPANYGDSGTIDPGLLGNWEEMSAANALGISFDIFNGAQPTLGNTVRLSLNGAANVAVADIPTGTFLLNNGVFNRVDITIDEQGDGNSLLSMTITPDINGTPGAPVQVFSDVLVTGLDLENYRAIFGARTGGAFTIVDLDNVNIAGIPEPSTFVLAALGVAGLALYRRKK